MKNKANIPLSKHAMDVLKDKKDLYLGLPRMVTILSGFFTVISCLSTGSVRPVLFGASVIVLIWTVYGLFFFKKWIRVRDEIIAKNELDYRQSQELNTGLSRLAKTFSNDYPVVEETIEGQWKPFRVEHFVSESIRCGLEGDIRLWGSLLTGFRGSFSGQETGMALPNLLDTSSVVFLSKGDETLRVLVPSPRATRDLLTRTIKQWVRNAPHGSHVQRILDNFSIGDKHLLRGIIHPQMIDSLDVSLEVPIQDRPSVVVRGEMVQSGVALATSLEVEGKQYVFLPSGFFFTLTDMVAAFIKPVQAPQVLTAVQ